MARASRLVRRHRRLRREATLARKVTRSIGTELRRQQTDYQRTYMTLLAVLAQLGGAVTVTHGTMVQVTEQAATLRWEVKDSVTPGEVIISVVEQRTPSVPPTTKALTITKIEDGESGGI